MLFCLINLRFILFKKSYLFFFLPEKSNPHLENLLYLKYQFNRYLRVAFYFSKKQEKNLKKK